VLAIVHAKTFLLCYTKVATPRASSRQCGGVMWLEHYYSRECRQYTTR